MNTKNLKKVLKLSLAAIALTSLTALSAAAESNCAPVGLDTQVIREVSSQAAAEQGKQEFKHRSLLNKEVREPRDSSHY